MNKVQHIIAMLALVALTAPATAQTVSLGSEFGGPPGLSRGDGGDQCHDPASRPFEQCKQIPHPLYAVGTFTVKNNSEVFMILECKGPNGDTDMYRAEHFQGTTTFVTPPFPASITGPCWVYYEVLNNSGNAQARGAICE